MTVLERSSLDLIRCRTIFLLRPLASIQHRPFLLPPSNQSLLCTSTGNAIRLSYHLQQGGSSSIDQKGSSNTRSGTSASTSFGSRMSRSAAAASGSGSGSGKQMKSNLSQILPVVEACHILGKETVARVIRSFLSFRTPNRPPTNEDVAVLVKALFYDPGENDVPQNIQTNWNRMTRRTSGLDKASFIKFMIPAPAAPYNAPGGHLGLFDCWVHALSASASNYAEAPGGNAAANPLQPIVLLPDILIVVAVCREFKTIQALTMRNNNSAAEGGQQQSKSAVEDLNSRSDYATMMLSILAYRVYDSYQKKGFVARDAIHRFLTDVIGDDSYKTTSVRKVLDIMFAAPNNDPINPDPNAKPEPIKFLPYLTPSQFANGIRKTSRQRHHILLDWMATLGDHMVPIAPLPPSVNAYLDALTLTNRSLELLCQNYGLANLYEIKRRFHSLVETNLVVQGDVMREASGESEEERMGNNKSKKPRHVISKHAFVKAATEVVDDMGHGGYLPRTLAEQVFHHGACPLGEDDTVTPRFWALFDILQFGCDAIRQPGDKVRGDITAELPLMRFAFRVFGSTRSKRDLNRSQIGTMLLLLLEHQIFRFEMDRPYYDDDDDDDAQGGGKIPPIVKKDVLEESLIDVSAASMLGILPNQRVDYSKSKQVSLAILIDACLDAAGMEGNTLAFDGFCKWHYSKDPSDLPLWQRRVGPFLVELRLMASVLFGVPPTKASMEESLIHEIQRRQKYRYPQTDVARRGPRGTVWYVIEDKWFKRWMGHVQRVAGNDLDIKDGRDVVGADSRGLGKINNTFLLADNGTLALKSDIRWRHDYEIIPPLAWSALQAWYDGGPPIHRTVVRYIPSNGAQSVHSRSPRVRTEYEIELYPFFVTVFMCDASSRGEARPFQQYAPVSRVSPVGVFLVQLCKGLDVDPKLGRIWMMENLPDDDTSTGGEDWLLNLELNVMEQRNRRAVDETPTSNRITLLLELKDPESGKWPRGLDGKTWTFGEKQRFGELNRRPGEPDTGSGIVGLYNMGNTCYLNSSIQCLSHTPIFRDYFTSKVYLNDINTTNPLGHQGRLAQVSAVLINSMWKRFNQNQTASTKRITAPGSYAPVNAPALTPKTFKDSLGKFNDLFAGNEQHDAQELLAFLLGGLSEDLNRIVEKPYIEAPDSDGRPDSELADIWWSNHLKREMSIIVALFTGQYKSLLTCRSCKYESARFEPFSFLQLPLPEDDQISVSLIFYPIAEKAQILKYSIRVRHDGKLLDVLVALSRVLHADETGEPLTNGNAPGMSSTGSKSDDEDIDDEFEDLLHDRAQTMAVVDMRDGYIFKIAPNTWALPDLQNKDTGELPLLHVYELDPLPEDDDEYEDEEEEEEIVEEDAVEQETTEEDSALENAEEALEGDDDEADEDTSEGAIDEEEVDESKFKVMSVNDQGEEEGGLQDEDDEDDSGSGSKYSFLALAQRRVEFVNRDVVHPFTHQVFGTPLLLRIVDLEGHTGSELYDLIALRLQPLVPKSALRFLTEAESASPRGENEKQITRHRRPRTLSEMEIVAAGPVPRYGFRLRITSREGKRCALCPWYQCCIGCLVPDDSFETIVACGDSISIDWHFAVDVATNGFGTRVNQPDQPVPTSPFRVKTPATISIKNHASCNDDAKKKGRYGGTITLENCLDAFAKEEKIPEAYCSSCKDFRVQTKHMSLWRLPPIVIIQLKRFQFTQHARRKLRDLVVFPVEGLDLSRILAPDSAAAASSATETAPSSEAETNTTTGTDDIYLNGVSDDYLDPLDAAQQDMGGASYTVEDVDLDVEEEDDPMSSSSYSGRTTGAMLYDLYAVVHHQGALSGGHYVASLKSEIDGQWRLFNDAQVYEIHSRDVVDSSAYILFYIRRDVKDAKLQDFWDIRARAGKGLTEEEVESLMKGRSDRCVIS